MLVERDAEAGALGDGEAAVGAGARSHLVTAAGFAGRGRWYHATREGTRFAGASVDWRFAV